MLQLFLLDIKTTTTTQRRRRLHDNAKTQQQPDYAVCMWYQLTC